MAKRKRPATTHKKTAPATLDAAQGDLEAFVEHIQENPAMYIGGLIFVLLAVFSGILYTVTSKAQLNAVLASYDTALSIEDPAIRSLELEKIETSDASFRAEFLYMAAEAAFEANDLERAASLFERVRNEFPDSPFTPDAVEGLGSVAEENGDATKALAYYDEVSSKWPDSFTARRQPFNKGRVHENAGAYDLARTSYEEQTRIFPETAVAQLASSSIERLRTSHPEVFPVEEEAPAEEAAEAVAPSADSDASAEAPAVTSEASAAESASPPAAEAETASEAPVETPAEQAAPEAQ